MGQTTPNISIYIPSAGETNYDASFAAGMVNVDQHDHTGGPNKGVPISGAGIAPGAITYDKLNANVVDTTTGLATHGGGLANQIYLQTILANIYNSVGSGFITKDGTNIHIRTITGTSGQINVSNGDGVAGNTQLSIPFGTTGFPGEVISSFVNDAGMLPTVTATPIDVTSIVLSAGTWNVSSLTGYRDTTGAPGLVVTQLITAISLTSVTTGSNAYQNSFSTSGPNQNSDISLVYPSNIITVAVPTTVYLVSNQVFAGGTMSVYGIINAIRIS